MAGDGRNLVIDALRGAAALAVAVMHFAYDFHLEHPGSAALGFQFRDGRFGVMLFFMISGYVIFFTAERKRTVAAFARARFLRLYPAYWAAIAATLALAALEPRLARPANIGAAAANVTMLQTFLGFPHVEGVYWTLHVELCFYALVAACLALRRVEWTMWALVAGVAADVALLFAFGKDPEWSPGPWTALLLPFKHWHLFLLGVLIARRGRVPAALAWGAAAACVLCATLHEDRSAGAKVAALAGVLLLAVQGRLEFLATRPLVFLGGISYSFYLVHRTAGMAAMLRVYDAGGNRWLALAAGLAVGLALATLLRRFVERPALRWGRRRGAP